MAAGRDRPPTGAGEPGGRITNDEIPRWMVVGGGTVVAIGVVVLIRYALDVAGIVLLVTLVVGGLRVVSEWTTDGDSASRWALGSVGLSVAGVVLVGFWLFGASRDPSVVYRNQVTAALAGAVTWAEAHGWGQRALLPGGRLDRSRARSTSTDASSGAIGLSGGPGVAAPSVVPRAEDRSPVRRGPIDSSGGSAPDAATRAGLPGPAPSRPQIGSMTTQTTVEVTPATMRAGTSARVTAIVTSTSDRSRVPFGVVVFRRGDLVLGTSDLARGGDRAQASLVVTDLPLGRHQVSAEFVADGPWRGSWSPPAVLSVVRR